MKKILNKNLSTNKLIIITLLMFAFNMLVLSQIISINIATQILNTIVSLYIWDMIKLLLWLVVDMLIMFVWLKLVITKIKSVIK